MGAPGASMLARSRANARFAVHVRIAREQARRPLVAGDRAADVAALEVGVAEVEGERAAFLTAGAHLLVGGDRVVVAAGGVRLVALEERASAAGSSARPAVARSVALNSTARIAPRRRSRPRSRSRAVDDALGRVADRIARTAGDRAGA